ncbi:MAG: YlxR family protein [Propioniciclava sp.]
MPIRTCIGCRQRDEQQHLLRLVRSDEGLLLSRTAPGRGAWIHPGCGQRAEQRRAVQRAFRGPAPAAEALADLFARVDGPTWAIRGESY